MASIADLTVDQITLFFLCFVRIASIIALLPIIGSRNVPMMVKAGLSFLLAVVIFPGLPAYTVDMPKHVFPFAVLAIKEVLIGMVIGYGCSLLFVGLQFAGRIVDQQMAFALVQVLDPNTDVQVTVMGQFKMVLFTMIFLMVSGHHFFLSALHDCFTIIPLCEVHIASGKLSSQMILMTKSVFVLALKMAAPVLVTLLMTTLGLGVIARTVPQMNVFIVGLPLKIGIGLFTVLVSIPLLYVVFQKVFLRLQEDVYILMDCLG